MIWEALTGGRYVVVRCRWARWAVFLFDGVPLRYIIVRSYIHPNSATIATEHDLAEMDAAQGWRATA